MALGRIDVTRDDLIEWRDKTMVLWAKRRQLGGFDVNAEAIMDILHCQLDMLNHLIDQSARPKKPKKKNETT